MKILIDFKNELLKRREVKAIVEAKSNPGFANALKIISEHFKEPEEKIVIRAVKSKFGRETFLIDSIIYQNVSDKERLEPKKKVKKEAPK